MADEHSIPPFAPDDDAAAGKLEIAADTVKKAAMSAGAAISEARRPGMPLDVLASITREAPLGALLAAFLLGFIVAQR